MTGSINIPIDNLSSLDLTLTTPASLDCVLSYKGSWWELKFTGLTELVMLYRLVTLYQEQAEQYRFKRFTISAAHWGRQYLLRFVIDAELAGQVRVTTAVEAELSLNPKSRGLIEYFIRQSLPDTGEDT